MPPTIPRELARQRQTRERIRRCRAATVDESDGAVVHPELPIGADERLQHLATSTGPTGGI